MKSVEPSSPKAQLAMGSLPAEIKPSCLPAGVKMARPPGIVAHRLPWAVDLHAVACAGAGRAGGFGVEEFAAFADGAIGFQRVGHDYGAVAIGVGDVQRFLIGREGNAVRPGEFARDKR